MEIPLKLKIVALDDLRAPELHQLRQILHGGWQLEIEVAKGDGQGDSLKVWVTPGHR